MADRKAKRMKIVKMKHPLQNENMTKLPRLTGASVVVSRCGQARPVWAVVVATMVLLIASSAWPADQDPRAGRDHLLGTPATCPTGYRTAVFTNYCDQPIWIGATGGAGTACGGGNTCPSGQVCNTTNNTCFWELPTPVNNSQSFELSSDGGTATICFAPSGGDATQWNGNLFGRTGCTSSGCTTGDCGGGTGRCNVGVGPTGPTTLSEFNLGGGTLGDN